MTLDDVGHFVRQHAGHLVGAGGPLYQTIENGDIATGGGECIDGVVVENADPERIATVEIRRQRGGQGLQVRLGTLVLTNAQLIAGARHDAAAECFLPVERCQRRQRRRPELHQAHHEGDRRHQGPAPDREAMKRAVLAVKAPRHLGSGFPEGVGKGVVLDGEPGIRPVRMLQPQWLTGVDLFGELQPLTDEVCDHAVPLGIGDHDSAPHEPDTYFEPTGALPVVPPALVRHGRSGPPSKWPRRPAPRQTPRRRLPTPAALA